MSNNKQIVAIALCCGASASLAQSVGSLEKHPMGLYMRAAQGQAALLPQEELVAALPYDGSSSFGARAQDFESLFDLYDTFIIEDIDPTSDSALGRFCSAGFGNDNPFGTEDVIVRIFENNGTGLPGQQTYTGSLIIQSIPGVGFYEDGVYTTDFGGQCLESGSYYVVWAARLDFACCGGSFFFSQSGVTTVGGGEENNAWQWSPGDAFGMGTHFPVEVNEARTGVNYLLFGTPTNCSFPCSNPDCPADLDGDGDTDADDFFAYLDLFASNDPCADIDQDGDADGDDFFAYLDLFVQGC